MKKIVKGRVARDDAWSICYGSHSNAVVPKEHHLHEECGVFGVFSEACADVASLAYYGLFALQHRGQESAGIVVNDDGVFTAYCDEY